MKLQPHGFVATVTAPLEEANGTSNIAELKKTATDEREFFEDSPLEPLIAEGPVGCNAVIDKVRDMYRANLTETWAPRLIFRLNREQDRLKATDRR